MSTRGLLAESAESRAGRRTEENVQLRLTLEPQASPGEPEANVIEIYIIRETTNTQTPTAACQGQLASV